MERVNENKNFIIIITFMIILMAIELGGINIFVTPIIAAISGALGGVFSKHWKNKESYKAEVILWVAMFIDLGAFLLGIYSDTHMLFIVGAIILMYYAIKGNRKYKNTKVIITLAIIGMFFSMNYYFYSTNLIKDKIFNRYIKNEISVKGKVKLEDLLEIEGIRVNTYVSNLKGIENMKNLKSISIIDDRGVLDYSQIANLTEVERITIEGGDLNNINVLNSMNKLKILDISHTGKRNLDAIEGSNTLEELRIYSENSEKLNLQGFKNVKKLSINGKNLKDLTGLQTLSSVRELSVSGSRDLNLNGVESLSNLEKLDIDEIYIEDVEALIKSKSLRMVSTNGCIFKDKEAVRKRLSDNGISLKDVYSVET